MSGSPDGRGSVCARCAARGTACCEVPEGEKLATLTFADIERIEQATGMPAHRFVEREQLDPAVRLAYETSRPIYRGMFVGGVRHGLKARDGACVFLERGRGCALPPEAKPMACRLYPFDFDVLGEVTLLDAPHCLALSSARSANHLLRMFGTSQKALRELRGQALVEAAAHAERLERRGR